MLTDNLFAGAVSCLSVDGCLLIRVVAAKDCGSCGNFLEWDNEAGHIHWLFLPQMISL